MINRRAFTGMAVLALIPGCTTINLGEIKVEEAFGIIGQMMIAPGKRDFVIAALLEGTSDMPGNIAYLIAEDAEEENAIWITEVWRTKTDHENSLKLPLVQAAIGKAREHITGFGTRVETKPVYRG